MVVSKSTVDMIYLDFSKAFDKVPYVDEVVAVTVMRVLLFVLHVCLLRECDVDGNAGVGDR